MSNRRNAQDLSSDPIIIGMTEDLVRYDVAPADEGAEDEGDFVFAAAMEYSFRGGDVDTLEGFDTPAKAVRIAYEDLTNS